MANIKSSEKANRQRITRTARNTAQKTAMRTIIKLTSTAGTGHFYTTTRNPKLKSGKLELRKYVKSRTLGAVIITFVVATGVILPAIWLSERLVIEAQFLRGHVCTPRCLAGAAERC